MDSGLDGDSIDSRPMYSIYRDSISEVFNEGYFIMLMNDITDLNQVEKLACHLNVRQSTVAQLKRDYNGDPVLVGVKVMSAWLQNLTCADSDEAKQELARALLNVDMGKMAKRVYPLIVNKKEPKPRVQYISQDVPIDKQSLVNAGIKLRKLNLLPHKKCSSVLIWWFCCYVILVFILLLSIAGIITFSFKPSTTGNVSPSSIRPNDSAELSFDLSTSWLRKITLSVDNKCNGSVYVHSGKCSDLYEETRACYLSDFKSLPIYLLKGSKITFAIPPNLPSPTDIWVVWNPDLLITYDFSTTSCSNLPLHTACHTAKSSQRSWTFSVSESSYYDIQFVDARHGIHITYNVCAFDTDRLAHSGLVYRSIQLLPVDIDIHAQWEPFNLTEVCVIFQVLITSRSVCLYSQNGGELTAELQRRRDILFLPALAIIVILLVLVGVIIGNTVYCIKVQRRQKLVVEMDDGSDSE